jgi:hypothetical protein
MGHKLISNRFEVFLLILLSMVVSTRLIWIQIDERQHHLTSEFYSSSLAFRKNLAPLCAAGVDPGFPIDGDVDTSLLDASAQVSPGLLASFAMTCQLHRLSVSQWLGLGTHLTTLTAFLVALTARVLTRNWVSGIIAAAVILSRGSLVKIAHTATAMALTQPVVAAFFLVGALFTRTRDPLLIPVMNMVIILAVFMSPVLGLVVWPPLIALSFYLWNKSRRGHWPRSEILPAIISTLVAVIAIPLMIFMMRWYLPGTTLAVAETVHQLWPLTNAWSNAPNIISSVIAAIETQDFHWQASIAIMTLATTWRRFLPSGSGAWSGGLLLLIVSALVVDGALIAAATRQDIDATIMRYFGMASGLASFEPVIIGVSAALSWFALKKSLAMLWPA